jgi:hypothetical protein
MPSCVRQRHRIDSELAETLSRPQNRSAKAREICIRQAIDEWQKEIKEIQNRISRRCSNEQFRLLGNSQDAWDAFVSFEDAFLKGALDAEDKGPERAERILEIVRQRAFLLQQYES